MTVPPNTYVVLDIPPPIDATVLNHRARQRDPFRFSLPAETTVSGSSGTGPFATDQDFDAVVAVLDRIASQTAPIHARFGPVHRFDPSDVYYLSFVDERPLRALHERIARSGLRFTPSAFPFTPHCTIRTRTPVSPEEQRDLEAIRIEAEFTLTSMSLYELPPQREGAWTTSNTGFATLLCLLHGTTLAGV